MAQVESGDFNLAYFIGMTFAVSVGLLFRPPDRPSHIAVPRGSRVEQGAQPPIQEGIDEKQGERRCGA